VVHNAKPKSLHAMVSNLIQSIAKAKVQLDAGKTGDCQTTLDNAIESIPNQGLVQLPLAAASIDAGELESARDHATRAIQADANCHDAFVELATAYLNDGDLEAAADCVRRCRSRFPLETSVLGVAQIIDAELGRLDESIAKPDYDTLLWQTDSQFPLDLQQALVDFILHQQLLETEPPVGTPRGFYRSRSLDALAGPVVAACKQYLKKAVAQYIDHLADSDPSVAKTRPAKLSIECWGAVTDSGGFMPSHTHRNAWLSGVVYLKVPDEMGDEGAGAIEFGRPPSDVFRYTCEPDVRVMAPAEGMLLMFPAYYWHGTVPHAALQPRVSLGFNVLGE